MKPFFKKREFRITKKQAVIAAIGIVLLVAIYWFITHRPAPAPDLPVVAVEPVTQDDVEIYGEYVGRAVSYTHLVPVSTADDKETGEKMLVTQYEGSVIEDTGLIKMDFLGLKTLSIIKEAVENVRLHRGLVLNIDKVPIDEPATYKLYSDGRTIGTRCV